MPRLICVVAGRTGHLVGFVVQPLILFWNQIDYNLKLGRFMRKGYLSYRLTAKAQASLHIHIVSPEPPLFPHTIQGTRGSFRQEPEIWPRWIAGHACLKEYKPYDGKVPYLMRRLKHSFKSSDLMHECFREYISKSWSIWVWQLKKILSFMKKFSVKYG